MFAIRITYLTGRVYSAQYDDGDVKAEPEWPPHPSRFFSALVSAWGEGGAEAELRPALEWLERQQPPAIHAAECSIREQVQAFVPVNDSALPPDSRPRKPRAFPSGTLSDPDVYLVWEESPPRELIEPLSRILQRTSALGHSASLIETEVASSVPESQRNVWKPGAAQGARMRVPYTGRLDELIETFRRFDSEPSKVFRPSRGESVLYAKTTSHEAPERRGLFDSMIVLRRVSGPRASLRSTLSLTTALRGAMMRHAPQPVAEFLSGHAQQSTPEAPMRSERTHVALVPLAHVGKVRYPTGNVAGLAVLLPAELSQSERTLCWDTFSTVERLSMHWGEWGLSVTDAEERDYALQPERWTGAGTIWSTVTPFVFDRFPNEPYGSEAQQNVRDAFSRAGLPEPVELDLHYNPWQPGSFKASAFPPAPARKGKPQRYHCHVWARFEQRLRGPVVAGAGRYYGYGLFLPLNPVGSQ